MSTATETDLVTPLNYMSRIRQRDNDIVWRMISQVAEETGLRIGFLSESDLYTIQPNVILQDHGHNAVDLIFAHSMIPEGGRQGTYNADWWQDDPETGIDTPLQIAGHPHGLDLPSQYERFWWFSDQAWDLSHTLGFFDERVVYMPGTPTNMDLENTDDLPYRGWITTITDAVKNAVDPVLNEQIRDRRRQQAIDMLVDTVQNRNTARLREIETEMSNTQATTIRLATELHRHELRLPQLKAQYDHVRARTVNQDLLDANKVGEMIAKINDLPKVTSIHTTTDGNRPLLNVTTEELPISVTMNDGETYNNTVGPFVLELDFVNIEIYARNLNSPNSDMDHPHIESGSFCLGGARQLVYGLMKDYQFDVAISVLIDQLQNVNPNDVYYGTWWDDFFPDQLDHYFNGDYDEEPDEDLLD